MSKLDYSGVMATLQEIFEDLADDLDMEDTDLDPNQSVLSLGIESISIVYLVSELQQHYGLGNRLFDELRANERLLKDMTLHDIVETVLKVAG